MTDQALSPTPAPSDGADPALLNGDAGGGDGTIHDDSPQEVKDRAREQGWRDADEFDGEPEKFISATEYLDRADKILPIVRARERETKQEVRRLADELEQVKKDARDRIAAADTIARRNLQDQYDALKKKRAQAVSDGDGEEFDRIDGEMQALVRDSQPKKVEVPPDAIPPALKTASEQFLDRNKWFQTDERKNRLAVVVAQEIIAKRPDLKNNPEFFPELEKQLRKDYPEQFGNPRRNGGDSMVEGDTRPSGPRSAAKKGFRDLPKDAQEAGRRQVKNGFCKDEQQYADIYFDTYGDA